MSGNIISQSWGGGGCFETNWSTEVVEIETVYEFHENGRFFTTSCDPYMGYTLKLFFTHFTVKRTQRMAFEKKV
jgi:hypothetical protein